MDGATEPAIFLRSRDEFFSACARVGVDVEIGRMPEGKLPAPERRKVETESARALGRALLARRGVTGVEIGRHESGYPIWPAGWVGSLSHSSGWCLAAQARTASVAGVGVDIENPARMKPAMWSHIMTERERRALEGLPAEEAARWATAAFGVKETVFKVLSPLGGVVPGFHGVEVIWQAGGRFEVWPARSEQESEPLVIGYGAFFEEMIVTCGWKLAAGSAG